MNLRNYVLGGILALTAGCASHMDRRLLAYKMQDSGIVVPKLGPVMAEDHRSKGFMYHNIKKYDTNHDKKADIIEIVTDDLLTFLLTFKSTARNLIVDTNKDGIADMVYGDMVRVESVRDHPSGSLVTRVTDGVDGKFDMAADARIVAILILKKEPTLKDLKLDNLASLLMDASER